MFRPFSLLRLFSFCARCGGRGLPRPYIHLESRIEYSMTQRKAALSVSERGFSVCLSNDEARGESQF